MSETTAKIFTLEELTKGMCDWADNVATISLNPNTPEACAEYVYENYGETTWLDTEES